MTFKEIKKELILCYLFIRLVSTKKKRAVTQ